MNANLATPPHWDPYNPDYFKNPYPVFARLREETPLYHNDQYGFYAVSRYADVERALGDWESFSSAKGDILEMIKANAPVPQGSFIHHDPPAHTVYRTGEVHGTITERIRSGSRHCACSAIS